MVQRALGLRDGEALTGTPEAKEWWTVHSMLWTQDALRNIRLPGFILPFSALPWIFAMILSCINVSLREWEKMKVS